MKTSKIIFLLIGISCLFLLINSCDNKTTEPTIAVTGVSLNQTTLSMQIGDTRTLTAIITPENATNKGVIWSSSDESVATVNDTGSIIGIAKGSTLVTATTIDGDFSAICVVTVASNTPNIPVTGVALNKTNTSILIGNTEALTAIISPFNATNQNVSWSSSNSSIATISDNGVVTAINQGSITITVTTLDGGFTDICQVAVNPAPTATFIIALTTSDGGSVNGATVILQNHVGGAYQETATSASAILTNIPFGSYYLIVNHSGYHPFIDETFSVQSHAVSHAVHLRDISLPYIGDIIEFGAYNWRVLDIQGGQALIVSENIIERRVYHTSQAAITWSRCSLRAYLNGDFYNSSAFSNEDRSRIVQVTNVNLNNQWFGTYGGLNTQDRIFLLSIAEVVQYFGDSGQLENRPPGASHINDQFNSNRIATINGSASFWWLRSPGDSTHNAIRVYNDGIVYLSGSFVSNHNGGVRPALWLQL